MVAWLLDILNGSHFTNQNIKWPSYHAKDVTRSSQLKTLLSYIIYNLNGLTFKGQKWPKSRKTCVERDRFFFYAFSVTFFSLSHFSSGNFPDGTPCLSWLKIGPHISPTAKSVAQSSAKAQPKRKFPFCNRK